MLVWSFYLLAAIASISALGVVLFKNPISSAISLVVTLASVACIFLIQDAPFVSTIQILVYAGAIMVLFVFVIMLLNLQGRELVESGPTLPKVIGVILGAGGLAAVTFRLLRWHPIYKSGLPQNFGTIEHVGNALFSDYLLPFELVSVLLTAAVVGAVIIAKREL